MMNSRCFEATAIIIPQTRPDIHIEASKFVKQLFVHCEKKNPPFFPLALFLSGLRAKPCFR